MFSCKSQLILACYLAATLIIHIVGAANKTYDNDDSSITYSGDWEAASRHRDPLDFGGSHRFSPDGTATFTFIGVAVYYLSPLWPFIFIVDVALDGGSTITVNLTDPQTATSTTSTDGAATVQSAPLWGITGLDNVEHTLTVSKAATGPFVIVDAFRVTTPDDGNSETSTSSFSTTTGATFSGVSTSRTSSSTSSQSSSSDQGSGSNIVGIAVGVSVVVAVLFTVIVLGICCWGSRDKLTCIPCFRRRRNTYLGTSSSIDLAQTTEPNINDGERFGYRGMTFVRSQVAPKVSTKQHHRPPRAARPHLPAITEAESSISHTESVS